MRDQTLHEHWSSPCTGYGTYQSAGWVTDFYRMAKIVFMKKS